MCLCTQYDSPTCGHSWISMSQPCGFCRDLLNCPSRQTYQTLVAPPMTCPQCNGGFGDAETIQMIQGPWGCNQLIRSHLGGDQVIPGQWGAVRLPQQWGPQLMGTGGGMAIDHRLTGPLLGGSQQLIPYGSQPVIPSRSDVMIYDSYYDDGLGVGGWDYGLDGRGRRSSRHYREYRRSVRNGPQCIVM